MSRPTTMRVAFEEAQITPKTNKTLAFRVLKRLPESIGYIRGRMGKLFSDGPRPKDAPSIEEFFKNA